MATDERTVLEQNKALVRRYLEEIYRGNYEVLEEVISPEYYAERPPGPPGLTPGARYATGFDALRRAFPDIRISLDAVIAEGDLVALHATLHGTHLGAFRGVPPTGKEATWTATAFRRVRDGKLVEGFATWDWLSALEQVGATVTVGGIPVEPRVAPPARPRTTATE
jgi:steroid delta-isomerase-like uncharacterized protein